MPEKKITHLYRYEQLTTVTGTWSYGSEEYGPPYIYSYKIILREIQIVRETEKSYFINIPYWGKLKRVPKEGKNLYAHATKKAAIENFFYKKVKQIKILNNRLEEAEHYKMESKFLFDKITNETIHE